MNRKKTQGFLVFGFWFLFVHVKFLVRVIRGIIGYRSNLGQMLAEVHTSLFLVGLSTIWHCILKQMAILLKLLSVKCGEIMRSCPDYCNILVTEPEVECMSFLCKRMLLSETLI